jgi:2-methylisocitrate lyase-like PEP mutase family enzyme
MMLDIDARRADFRALHEIGFFLLPTVWDVGSAKHVQKLGFAGFASSNTSLAWALGRDDGYVTRDQVLAHLRQLVNATEIGVNGDFGSGFAADLKELMANVRLAIDTGVAALSVRDTTNTGLYDSQEAIARVQSSHDAIATSGADVLLVACSAGLQIGHASVDDTIGRLAAYSDAGADVLCAPGLSDLAAIRTLVETVAPKAVDVQLTKPGMRAAEFGELGVRRISAGDSFVRASRAGFERITQRLIDFGDLLPESFSGT